ncbi:MAG: ORF6N domain-containing protein [Spirochaetales bacterium]|nr:ORF6N domain-containing protein [Spirochaetales bacterium]
MLDFELVVIYGYTTSAFNQQVKRNDDKFPADFRFRLTQEEYADLLSQNVTASWGGDRRSELWAFTESGIYMLMTVLKGTMATKQSIALIRTFRSMKEYIIENQGMIGRQEYLRLSMQMTDSIREGMQMRRDLDELSDEMKGVLDKLSDVVSKSEIAPILLELGKPEDKREYLFLDGQPMKADAAYISIYSQAKKSIHYVDDYLGAKTLHLLQDVQPGVVVTIFSDNKNKKLSLSDYQDFQTQFPIIPITFITTQNKAHDRFVVLDYGTADERIFHCGPSSKDAGKKLSAITEFSDGAVKQSLHDVVANMFENPQLILT